MGVVTAGSYWTPPTVSAHLMVDLTQLVARNHYLEGFRRERQEQITYPISEETLELAKACVEELDVAEPRSQSLVERTAATFRLTNPIPSIVGNSGQGVALRNATPGAHR